MLGFMRQFDGHEHLIAPVDSRESVRLLQQGVRLLFNRWKNHYHSLPFPAFTVDTLLLTDSYRDHELRFTAVRRMRRNRIQSSPSLSVEVYQFGPTPISERGILSMTSHGYSPEDETVIRFDGEDMIARLLMATRLSASCSPLTSKRLFAAANSEVENFRLAKERKFNEQPVGPGEVAALVAASMFGEPL